MLDTTVLQHSHHNISGFVRCKYPGKFCRQQRARKRNGQLHRFCAEHRSRANDNQKRWSASRLQRWETLAQSLGDGHTESRLTHQDLDFTALLDQVQDLDCNAASFPYPLQFTNNVAFATDVGELNADLDGFLNDFATASAPDAYICEVPAYEPTWRV